MKSEPAPLNVSPRRVALLPCLLAALLLMASMCAAVFSPHTLKMPDPPKLVDVIPKRFGDWKMIENNIQQVSPYYVGEHAAESGLGPYSDILARSYVNSAGEVVHLMLAYVNAMTQETKVHRPEVCYRAAGYDLSGLSRVRFDVVDDANVPVGNMLIARRRGQAEVVRYWIRVGNIYSSGAFDSRSEILVRGLGGLILDGMLFRVSVIRDGGENADLLYQSGELMDGFTRDLLYSVNSTARTMMVKGDEAKS